MEKKQGSISEADFHSLPPEMRAAVLMREGRLDELSQEEVWAVTRLFDLPADMESVIQIDGVLSHLRAVVQETHASVEEYEEDGLHFLVFTPAEAKAAK